jgi:hypothetical protein
VLYIKEHEGRAVRDEQQKCVANKVVSEDGK